MNVGMIVLVGCVVGSGAIVYRGTTGGAAPAATPSVDGAAHSAPRPTVVIEPTAPHKAATPATTPTPTPTSYPKLTLDQVRALARPPATSAGAPEGPGPKGANAPRQAAAPDAPSLEPPALTAPAATTMPESGAPPPVASPPPVATTTPPPVLATPPPLPPMPEGVGPRSAPTEQPR